MLLQSAALLATKLLVYYKITACIIQIYLLGVSHVEFRIEKHCLEKTFPPLETFIINI